MNEYCYYCDKDLLTNIKEKEITLKIKNKDISFVGKIAYCANCGEEVFIASLRDENILKANHEYRKLGWSRKIKC